MSTSSRQPDGALTFVSAKQPAALRKRDWYPYYAGFTETFVNSVAAAFFGDTTRVLDPWSGSGTTAAACTKRGLPSIGVDINPALTVIARARLEPITKPSILKHDVLQLLAAAKGRGPAKPHPNDLLSVWIQPRAVCRLRAIQGAIHRAFLTGNAQPDQHRVMPAVDALPKRVCFYYSALFFVVRNLLAPFRTSNPMWIKEPPSHRHRIAPSWTTLSAVFQSAVEYLGGRLSSQPQLAPSTALGLPRFHGRLDFGVDGV